MIISEDNMFAKDYELTLENNTHQNLVPLPNVIDLSVSKDTYFDYPNNKRDISGGDPIPLIANIDSLDDGMDVKYSFILQTSQDRETWIDLFQSEVSTNLDLELNIDNIPYGTRRYLRMAFSYQYVTALSDKKIIITAGIGSYQPYSVDGL